MTYHFVYNLPNYTQLIVESKVYHLIIFDIPEVSDHGVFVGFSFEFQFADSNGNCSCIVLENITNEDKTYLTLLGAEVILETRPVYIKAIQTLISDKRAVIKNAEITGRVSSLLSG